MDIKECDVCGAMYSITHYHSIIRDKDSINCNYCGNELLSWNGSTVFRDEEISGPTKEYKKMG